REARRSGVAGTAHRRAGVRARAPETGLHARVLPGRGAGERGRPGAERRRGRRRPRHARGGARGRSAAVRHPTPGRAPNGVLWPPAGLLGSIFAPRSRRAALSDRAWLQAMLDAERALAVVEARLGVTPPGVGGTIATACEADRFDPEELGSEARNVGNPAEPL